MASRDLAPVRTITRELIPIVGSFAPNGAAAIVATSRKGLGYSVARTAAGLFKVTLTDKYADIVAVKMEVQLTVAADITSQVGVVTMSSGTVAAAVELRAMSSAVPTDIAAAAGNRVNFVIWTRNSANKPTFGA